MVIGVPCENRIAQMAEQYFYQLFTLTKPVNMEIVLDLVEHMITPTMNESLL